MPRRMRRPQTSRQSLELVAWPVDLVTPGLFDVDRADDRGHETDAAGVYEAGVDRVAAKGLLGPRGGRGRGCDQRQEAAKPSKPEVIRQRHGRVADRGGKQLDQEGSDRPIGDAYID